MKKTLLVLLTLTLIFALFSCSSEKQPIEERAEEAQELLNEADQFLEEHADEIEEMKDYDSAEEYAEDKVDELMGKDKEDDEIFFNGELKPLGYNTEIPPEIYTTPADENGLGGAFYVLDGHLESFMNAEEYDVPSFDSMYFADITTPEGNEIVVYNLLLESPTYSIEDYQNMVGKDVRVWFEYQGYSDVKDVAMGTFFFMTDDPKGFDEKPIELDFDINAETALNALLEEKSITCDVNDYVEVIAECEYKPGMDTDAAAEEYREIVIAFYEKQEVYFGFGTLTFSKNGEEKALYDIYQTGVDKIR